MIMPVCTLSDKIRNWSQPGRLENILRKILNDSYRSPSYLNVNLNLLDTHLLSNYSRKSAQISIKFDIKIAALTKINTQAELWANIGFLHFHIQ